MQPNEPGMTTPECPSHEQLVALLTAELAEESAEELFAHLETCAACRSTLNDQCQPKHNTKQVELQALDPEPSVQCPAFQRAVAKIEQFGSDRMLTDDHFLEHRPQEDDAQPDLIGAQLDQYRIVAKLGAGGMGTVYKAVHRKLEKVVALKILPAGRLASPERVARFEREMLSVGRLNHPHIVGAMDAREIDGTHFLVMEYLEGIDLSALVEQTGPLPIADACEIVRQAAVGLQHAHQHDLIHRDMKPSNLLLTTDGQVKILDLGLAQIQRDEAAGSQLTSTGQIMGTPDYMAPEQIDHTVPVDTRADLYGLGCTLYKLLTGETPFAHLSFASTYHRMKAHIEEPALPVSECRSEISSELVAIVERLLAKDPADRYDDPQQLADALKPFTTEANLKALHRHVNPQEEAKSTQNQEPSRTDTSVLSATVDTSVTHQDLRSVQAGQPSAPPSRLASAQDARHRSTPRYRVAMAVVGFALVAIVGVRLVTNTGEVTIKSYDPSLEVVIKRRDRVVDEFEVRQRHGSTSYYAGEYEIKIKGGEPDGITIKNRKFALTRGGKILVEILSGETVARTTSERAAAQWVLKVGGELEIHVDGKIREVGKPEDLPAGDIRVSLVRFDQDSQIDDESLSGLSNLQSLESLVLQYTNISGAGFRHLSGLQGLRNLDFSVSPVTNQSLSSLKQLHGLTQLNLYRTKVTDEGMKSVATMKSLQYLNLTGISDAGVHHLTNLPQLEYLHIEGEKVTNEGLKHISGIKGLVGLSLRRAQITDEGLEFLKDMDRLRSLDLSQTPISGTGLKHLFGLESLAELRLQGTKVTDEGMKSVATMKTLQQLNLTGISDAGVRHLTNLPQLEYLHIEGEKVTNEGLKHVSAMKGLVQLFLPGAQIADEGLALLKDLDRLRILDLSRTPISGTGLEHLSGLMSLTELRLQGTKVTDEGMKSVATMKTLQYLHLSGISDAGVRHLTNLPQLEYLHIEGEKVTNEGLKHISAMKGLVQLFLPGAQIADEGLALLKDLDRLRILDLSRTPISDTELKHLSGLKSLTALRLHSTSVTAKGVAELKKSLPGCTITAPIPTGPASRTGISRSDDPERAAAEWALSIGGRPRVVLNGGKRAWISDPRGMPNARFRVTGIDVGGVEQVNDQSLVLLKNLQNLSSLTLSRTNVSDEGLRHLAGLPALRHLRLDGCSVSDRGLSYLVPLADLEALDLRATQITDNGLKQLTGMKSLQRLTLSPLQTSKVTAYWLAVLKRNLPDCYVEHRHIDEVSRDRRSTEWVLSIGGSLLIRVEGEGTHLEITALEQLPPQSFVMQSVMLPSIAVTDDDLENLTGLPTLATIDLSDTGLTDRGLRRLIGLPGLRQLYLGGTSVTSQGLSHLERFKQLEILALTGTNVPDEGLKHVGKLVHLRQLSLVRTKVTDAGLAHLRQLTDLQVLQLRRTKVSDAGLEYLRRLDNLRELSLSVTDVTDAGLAELAQITSLETLELPDASITATGLAHLRNFANLKTLYISGAQVTDSMLADLAKLKKLEQLMLDGTAPVSDAGLRHLMHLPNLRGLSLSSPEVTDTGLRHLMSLPNLRRLHIYDSQITDAGVADLGQLSDLERLILGSPAVTDTACQHLTKLSKLSHLDLLRTQVTDTGIDTLRTALPNCSISVNSRLRVPATDR